ncbi:hypothetical protein BGW38_000143 [Lunasporangiospora selenospora]|uniref:Zn(2)-C6 fungal-type domain-containing protein n=1 Tax=Lunasporangiospora selenospora TaxID=979761 RepID=A0A9P6KF14_9FUNG|nr:hypothetical protein BGW38_000143 [Lunasporangiospora selenospora]
MTKIKPRLIARISCQECRRRKTRCNFDGQSDKCSTCARIGTPCVFAQKNGIVLDIDKVMEENNPHLVHQREKEQRAKERERQQSAAPSVHDPASMDISDVAPNMNKRNSGGGSPRSSHHRSSRSRSVPLVDIQPDLIDLYFEHVHPYLLVLHKPSFLRRLHDPKDPVPDFLLAAIYAVASNYAPNRQQDGRRYFEFWLSRLDDTLDKPRLSTIQALLLIIKYQEGVKQTGFYFRTYMYTQMVIVLARELQLHKTTPVNMKLDPESHEVRRRLFWSIFILDQFISVSQGRTMSFREVEPEADLPGTDTEDPSDRQEIENILNIVEYIKLAKINHQALMLVRKFLTKVVTPEETVPQGLLIHENMVIWKKNLPARLQLASNMSPHTPFVAMLHILYHACCIMVQRCYCEDPSISHLEIATISRETCTISGTNITIITDDLFTNHGMVPLTYPIRGCYFVIYCLIAAATIQANDLRRGTNSPIMFKRSLALLNIILRQSTAVDIEKEVELLKNSMEMHLDLRNDYSFSSSSASSQGNDYRPTFKPILPMSQKYGARIPFGASGVPPIRMRRISPKVSGPASASSVSGSSTNSSLGVLFQNSNSTNGVGSGGVSGNQRGGPTTPGHAKSMSFGGSNSHLHTTDSKFGIVGSAFSSVPGATETYDHLDPVVSAATNHPSTLSMQDQMSTDSKADQPWRLDEKIQSKQIQRDHRQTLKNEEHQQLDEMEQKFKSSPSPDITSRALPFGRASSSSPATSAPVLATPAPSTKSNSHSPALPLPGPQGASTSSAATGMISSSNTFMQSVPAFSSPLLSTTNFGSYTMTPPPQQSLLSTSAPETPAPLLSMAQLLAFQEHQQRLQQQPSHQGQSSFSVQTTPPISSLDQLTAAQIQELHRLNQQRQFMQLQQQHQQQLQQQLQQQFQQQQQQQQQQQTQSILSDPPMASNFLSNFSNLNNYRQLNSDQAQNELILSPAAAAAAAATTTTTSTT